MATSAPTSVWDPTSAAPRVCQKKKAVFLSSIRKDEVLFLCLSSM